MSAERGRGEGGLGWRGEWAGEKNSNSNILMT